MQHGRFITAAAAALAVMAIGPAGAMAAPGSVVDDSAADFGAGAPGIATTVVSPGSVQLTPTQQFDGSALPAGFTLSQWANSTGGTGTVNGGTLTVEGARVTADTSLDPGQVLEWTGRFSGEAFQHVGFGNTANTTFEDGPWAIFSTGDGSGLFAAASTAAGVQSETPIPILGVDVAATHTYRIEWSPTAVTYSIDGTVRATQNVVIAGPMRPAAGDFTHNAAAVMLDSARLLTGTFQSRVLDAGDTTASWGTLATDVTGTSVTNVETRSGQTATPDGTWSAFQPLSGSAIQSPAGRYIQYRAKLNTTDASATPSLNRVALGFEDSNAPGIAVQDAQVSGTTASLAFSSGDADLAGFQCSLDGGAFAACASPAQFAGLAAGAHTASVRAVDRVGNASAAVAKTFTVAGSTTTSGGTTTTTTTTTTTSGGGNSAVSVDKTKPTVSAVAKSLRVSKTGTVSFRVGCPATEKSCTVTLQLKSAGKTVASKTATIKGGKTATVTLKLTKSARQQLAKRGSLKLSSVVSATDAAGNHRTTTKQLTVRRAAG